MLASDIINRAARTLSDLTNVRWTEEELLDYTWDGECAVVLHRPDANAQNVTVPLTAGTKQSIPADGIRFLRAIRNMGNGGNPGRAIRECSRVALDNELPDWHGATPSDVIKHFVFNNVDPKHFYVYPPATGGSVSIEIVYSTTPARLLSPAQELTLPDHYLNPVYDWVLYRAYAKDASYAGNMARAQSHLQAFAAYLGVNMQIEFAAATSNAATPTPASAPMVRTGG